jgi:sulfite exporter TauE/SafE
MTTIFFSALALGAFGSFHCIGMCGPIAFSLPLAGKGDLAKFTGTLLYNFGRIVTYSCLGLLLGLTGASLALIGIQQLVSIIAGVLILVILLWPGKLGWTRMPQNGLFYKTVAKIRSMIGRYFNARSYWSLFMIGLLNGLLPCGLVYMAITGAIISADPLESSLFMACFGLGTLPVMWSVSFFGNYISTGLRQRIRRVYPVLLGLMACLLIVRGMGLGIPYLSPKADVQTREMRVCPPAP